MPKYKVHGHFYEPGEFSGSDGYVRFWDVIAAADPGEAIRMAEEDYGDYNAIEVHGIVKDKADEKAWVALND